MKTRNHILRTIPLVILALALVLVFYTPQSAFADGTLGASKACAGHTLGEVNGCQACMEGENLHICENNFPDANFRGYLTDELFGSDSVPVEQVNNQTEIACSNRTITSLKGIEFFGALESLYCSSNQLTSLDVSHNPALESLYCDSNQLTSLDVSQNPALYDLESGWNQLTSLDVSHNPALVFLHCHSNQLTSLDVSHNPALHSLFCYFNQLTSLDVSHNPALLFLNCPSNQLTSLDVSQNPALEYLFCESNQLTSLDVSQNPALERLSCSENQLTSLDVSQNPALKELYCYSNQLTSLDLSHNPALMNIQSTQRTVAQIDNPTIVDLKALVGADKLGYILSVKGGSYDSASGLVTLEDESTSFSYVYDTNNEKAGNMTVFVDVETPKITLTYEFGGRSVKYEEGDSVTVEAYSGRKTNVNYSFFWPTSEDGEYYITYWKIRDDESGKLYAHWEEFTPYEDTVFEAVWKKKCVIKYNFEYENLPLRSFDSVRPVELTYSEPRYYDDIRAMDTITRIRQSWRAAWEDDTTTHVVLWIYHPSGNLISEMVNVIGWREIVPQHNQVYIIDQEIYPQGDMTFYAAWNLGWNRTLGRNWYYMGDNTFPVSCFKEIEGETYYFDELGFAVTGIYEVEGKQYLFDEDGVLMGEIIPPSEDALKEAAGVSDDSTDVIMDVEKQEGEADPADVEKIEKEVSEEFKVVAAFDIKLFAVEYDAEGKEISREPITQLNKPVLLTFVTPGAEGKTYQVVRIHVNEKGEVEVALLPTTDNGDGTVSAESDKFSMYYVVEKKESQETNRLPGDVNDDGEVTLMDLVRLCKYLAGYDVEIHEQNSDVNGDGQVTLMDLVRLCKYLAGYDVVLE